MRKHTRSMMVVLFCAAVGLVGCSSDDDNTAAPPAATPPAATNPAPPRLGNQIERMGRAVINTANTDPFFREAVNREKVEHDVITDQYNLESDPSQWVARFASLIELNLGVLDALDGNCTNQILADLNAGARRYQRLAAVLADDQLYVNTASGTCQQYLAVEGNVSGFPNTDCGGRTPLHNTPDVSYSVLAIGALTGVTNGILRDAEGTASLTVFPFLTGPN